MTDFAASVTVRPQGGLQSAAWSALIELAPHLGIEWTLIGGQMVFLHQAERQLQSPIAVFTLAAMLLPEDSRGANFTRNEHRLLRSALDDVRAFGSPDAPNVADRLRRLIGPSAFDD